MAPAGHGSSDAGVSAGELSALKAELARQADELDQLKALVRRMAGELGIPAS